LDDYGDSALNRYATLVTRRLNLPINLTREGSHG